MLYQDRYRKSDWEMPKVGWMDSGIVTEGFM